MAAPTHLRVTATGTFGPLATPFETWSTGFAVAQPGATPTGYTQKPTEAQVDQVVTAISAWFARTTSLFSGYQHLRGVTVSNIGDNGRVLVGADGAYVQTKRVLAPVAGAASASLHPYQVALAASLQTARVGAVGRGRMFLPVHAGNLGTDGLLAVADATSVAASLTTMLQACATALQYPAGVSTAGAPPAIVVASGGSALQGIPAANYRVTNVRVGRAFDTMRSRRRNLLEQYVQGTAL